MTLNVHANCVGRLYRNLVLYDILITILQPQFGSLFRNYYVFFSLENFYAMYFITYFYLFNYAYIVFTLVLTVGLD